MQSEKLNDTVDTGMLIHQSVYAKKLRPLLPPAAFQPDSSKLVILLINMGILLLGWGIADRLNQWPIYLLWLYLPLALIMGNSIVAMSFISHDFMHGSVQKKSRLSYIISFLGFAMLFMPPTQWKTLHNIVHHSQTNSVADPDRNYLYEQPNTWGKKIQDFFVPSLDFNPVWFFIIGMAGSWLFHNFSNLSSILLFNNKSVDYVPAAFTVSEKDRWTIALELLAIFGLHFSILFYLDFHPLKLALGYFLPLAIGHSGIMFYIYTNHLICRMTSINDPLINSLSLRVPKIVDLLHFNFSYHTEHHIFPSLNSDYYPLVQELIEIHYPGRMNLLTAGEAWQLLMETPRHYKDDVTLTDYSGKVSVNCPLDNSDVMPLDSSKDRN
ncbi:MULTISPECIES: fatty acid desaturase family protein [Kamptonema]|uniref:fatty acid desaturase family protein n=1 Tax=Kamptonema TaxID=1501433 RepID=UPI0001DAD08D|nr:MULTISPECIES: fatty acid desaturase [Kamptonema]CBN57038.1 Fatty acid desaturase [Kamptonema sp. PCC 6506]